jgi:hypothetical protein
MASPTPALLPRGVVARTTTRRRLAAIISRWPVSLPLRLLQRRVGVEAHGVTSSPAKHPAVMTVVPIARCTTPCATAPESAKKSRGSWNSTASS